MTETTTASPVVLPTLIDAQRKTTEQFSRLCEEGLRFASLRTEENRRALRELAASRGLPETVSAWTNYMTRATQQYTDELRLVTAICSEPVRDLAGDEPAVLQTTRDTLARAEKAIEETTGEPAAEPAPDAAETPRAN